MHFPMVHLIQLQLRVADRVDKDSTSCKVFFFPGISPVVTSRISRFFLRGPTVLVHCLTRQKEKKKDQPAPPPLNPCFLLSPSRSFDAFEWSVQIVTCLTHPLCRVNLEIIGPRFAPWKGWIDKKEVGVDMCQREER